MLAALLDDQGLITSIQVRLVITTTWNSNSRVADAVFWPPRAVFRVADDVFWPPWPFPSKRKHKNGKLETLTLRAKRVGPMLYVLRLLYSGGNTGGLEGSKAPPLSPSSLPSLLFHFCGASFRVFIEKFYHPQQTHCLPSTITNSMKH